jgi:hypothetical protein
LIFNAYGILPATPFTLLVANEGRAACEAVWKAAFLPVRAFISIEKRL